LGPFHPENHQELSQSLLDEDCVDGLLLDFSNSGGNSNHNVSSPFHHF
jgi:hypothetical protein